MARPVYMEEILSRPQPRKSVDQKGNLVIIADEGEAGEIIIPIFKLGKQGNFAPLTIFDEEGGKGDETG